MSTIVAKLTNTGRKARFFASRGPAYYAAYARWRLGRGLEKIAPHSFVLTDETLLSETDLDLPELADVKAAMAGQDNGRALSRLAAHISTGPRPVFSFDRHDRAALGALVDEDGRGATIRAADAVCRNEFAFRGAPPVVFERGIDWKHCPDQNVDWMWDLNRHAYFETLGRAFAYTGDERYVRKFRELLMSWLADNPAGTTQVNWRSVFEVAFRINTWAWAFAYFRGSPVFDRETCLAFLKGLWSHGRYLDAHIERHVPNNHLLLEAKALAMLGLLFPEFKESRAWQRRGLKLLYRELKAQVCPDGVHGERSTHYHRVITGELLELMVLMENLGLPFDPALVATLNRMVEFELWVTKPSGQIPLLSDSALDDTHLRFAAASAGPVFLNRPDLAAVPPHPTESDVWLLGAKRLGASVGRAGASPALDSRAFPEGGYFVMRAGQGSDAAYLVVDGGPFGHKPMPNHGHADALSFELHAWGETLLVDPGVYSTSLGETWRNYFRGTRAHNAVVVDEQDQSVLMDTRRVARPAETTVHQWVSEAGFDFFDGSHDGYVRLSQPVVHRRQIFFVKPEYWIVIDVLTGRGRHCFDVCFQLMPDLDPTLDARTGVLQTANRARTSLAIAPFAAGDFRPALIIGSTDPIQGWVSFYSGRKEPSPTLRYRQERTAPIQFCTVLYPAPAGRAVTPIVSRLDVAVDGVLLSDSDGATGLSIDTGTHVDYFVIDRGPAGARKTFAGYETDARFVHLRHRKSDGLLLRAMRQGGDSLLYRGVRVQ